MILKEERLYREADKIREEKIGRAPFKRNHLLVRCDICLKEWLAISYSFKISKSYHENNDQKMDLCKHCRTKLDYQLGIRNKTRHKIVESEILKEIRLKNRKELTKHSQGYLLRWIQDENHPRLNKKRDCYF